METDPRSAENPTSDDRRGQKRLSRRELMAALTTALVLPGCVAGARRAEDPSGLEVKASWQIPLADRPAYAERLAWAPDNRRLAVGSVQHKHMSVWDVRAGHPLPAPGDQAGGVDALAYSPDGQYLVVSRGSIGGGSERYSVSIRDGHSGVLIQGLVEDPNELKSIQASSIGFSRDGRYLAVGYSFHAALYTQEGSVWRRTGGLGPGARAVGLSPDGASIAIYGSARPHIFVCRVPSLEVLRDWPAVRHPDWGYQTLAYRSSGGQIAAGYGRVLGIFSSEDGRVLRELKAQFASFWSLAYSPDGRYLAAADSAAVHLFDSETWSELAALPVVTRPYEIAFSPDGAMLAATQGSNVKIWEFSR